MKVKKKVVGRRIKRLDISESILVDFLKLASKNALPKDAKILRILVNQINMCFEMVIESKEFPILPEGSEVPKLEPPVISSGILG